MSEVPFAADHDPLELSETLRLLTAVGNHEAKALFVLYLSENPGFLSKSQMGNGFGQFIGLDAVWTPSKATLFQYCEDSLGPIGSVVEGSVKNPRGLAKAYALSDYGRQLGVPAGALVLDWSLRYPDVSVQNIFGATVSPSDSRAIEGRTELFTELLTRPGDGVSFGEASHVDKSMGERTYSNYHKYASATEKAAGLLAAVGILRVESVYDANTSKFTIIDPAPLTRGGPERGLVSQAAYAFIAECHESGKTEFNYEDCLRYVLGWVQTKDPDIEPALLRTKVSTALSGEGRIKGIRRQSTYNDGQNTRVYIEEGHRDSLNELFNLVIGIADNDQTLLDYGTQLAQQLVTDKGAKKALMAKAERFSSHAQLQPVEVTMQEVAALLANALQAVDLEQITERYGEEYKRPLSKPAIADILRRLVATNSIRVSRERPDPTRRNTRNFYYYEPQELQSK